MSKQYLHMKYHPAKKEVLFHRFQDKKEVAIRSDSRLMKYMNEKGDFILQDHGNSFFDDIASNENVLPQQEKALDDFLKAKEAVNDSKAMVEKYVLENNRNDLGEDNIENIFKYVIPKYLYVKRNEDKHVVAIMCNYKFDMENGLAIVFENEEAIEVGKQDIIL